MEAVTANVVNTYMMALQVSHAERLTTQGTSELIQNKALHDEILALWECNLC